MMCIFESVCCRFGHNSKNPNQGLVSEGEDSNGLPTVQPTFQQLLYDKTSGPVSQTFQLNADDEEPSKKSYLNHIRHGLRKQKKQHSRAR